MIYRKWSLLSSTVVIWGGVATAGLAGIFLLGGKVLPSVPIPGSRARPIPSPLLRRPCTVLVSAAPSV
jgi:hypothetical protein